MKKLSSKELLFVKNLFFTTILGGIIGILNYLFNIFVARYTDQNIFSIFSSALGIIYLLQIPAVAIQAFVTKIVANEKEKDLNHFKWYSFIVFALIGIVFSTIFFLSKNSVANLANIPVETVLFLALTFLFAFITPVPKGLLLGLEKIKTVNLILLFETILRFAMGALAIRLGGSISILILANSLPAMLTTIFIVPFVKFKKENKEKIKIDFKELTLISISFLLLTTPFTLPLILVNPSFRAEYGAVTLLGKLVYYASIITASVMFARVSNEKVEKGRKRSLIISLVLSVSIGLTLSLFFFLFKDFVVSMSVGEQYLAVSNYIAIYALCMTGFAATYMITNFFISKGEYQYLYILLLGTVLQIVSFVVRNDTLDMVMQNQIVVYSVLTVLTFVSLLFNFKKINDERKKGENN
ncbi:MAG: oligosaccharide flippase family protein [Candidatus Dojkabacteria bacterium]|nr:oligosaccharide flippase family protein [Candidatus Dojkabacteria bacterium]MDD4561359.1 oligosaccharide flippase family protein [Candidatus Dojkabacteria bacterium]